MFVKVKVENQIFNIPYGAYKQNYEPQGYKLIEEPLQMNFIANKAESDIDITTAKTPPFNIQNDKPSPKPQIQPKKAMPKAKSKGAKK